MQKLQLGKKGEDLALKYLRKKGYQYLDRNFRTSQGEIDLIFVDNKTLVFVEVKTRTGRQYGLPEEAVTLRKLNSIIKAGSRFKQLNSKLPDSLRIDVVAVEIKGKGCLNKIRHYKNVSL